MAQKHALTILHCVLAAVLTPVGLAAAGRVGERDPLLGLLGMLGAVILPVLVATRVAWASGYEAGRQSYDAPRSDAPGGGNRIGSPDRVAPPAATEVRS
jgi:hypothetical protein